MRQVGSFVVGVIEQLAQGHVAEADQKLVIEECKALLKKQKKAK